jgi:hypothetical protein
LLERLDHLCKGLQIFSTKTEGSETSLSDVEGRSNHPHHIVLKSLHLKHI